MSTTTTSSRTAYYTASVSEPLAHAYQTSNLIHVRMRAAREPVFAIIRLRYAIYTSHSKRGSQVHKFNLMKRFWCLALLLVCTGAHTVTAQQVGCNDLSATNGLITGSNKNGVIPDIRAPPGGKYILYL